MIDNGHTEAKNLSEGNHNEHFQSRSSEHTGYHQACTNQRSIPHNAELRKITPCQPFESVHVVMKRHALNLAKAELMGL